MVMVMVSVSVTLIHAMRRNLDVTYIVMDNQIYGLTTGQASPTTSKGQSTKSTPKWQCLNPAQSVGSGNYCGATYVARGFSGEAKQLADLNCCVAWLIKALL